MSVEKKRFRVWLFGWQWGFGLFGLQRGFRRIAVLLSCRGFQGLGKESRRGLSATGLSGVLLSLEKGSWAVISRVRSNAT